LPYWCCGLQALAFSLFAFSGFGVGCLSCWLMALVVSSINSGFVVSVFWVFG
jgi:hypothetical protein